MLGNLKTETAQFECGAELKRAKVEHGYDDDDIVKNIAKITESESAKFAALVPAPINKPQMAYIAHDASITYKIVYYDLETTCRQTREAEICQISAITDDGATFTTFVLPEGEMDWEASMVNKITIEKNEGGQRRLYKDGKYVESVDIELAIDMFTKYLEDAMNGGGETPSVLVLFAHNGARFDNPILIRIGGTPLVEKLSKMNTHFGDTLPLLRTIKEHHPLLQPLAGERSTSLMQTNVYQRLFNEEYRAHDALEDVLALKRIITSTELAINVEYLINHGKVISVDNTRKDLEYKNKMNSLEETFYGELYTPWNIYITSGMTKKIAAAGLSFSDLLKLFKQFGKVGVVGILTMPVLPSGKPRVTKNRKVLNDIIGYFQSHHDKENDNTNH